MNTYMNNQYLLIDVLYEYTNNLLEHENWDALNYMLTVAEEMCVEYCVNHEMLGLALLSQTFSERHRLAAWESFHTALSAAMGPIRAKKVFGHLTA